ncbi:MAG: hypothetical protein IIC03_03815 [Proteobacteria bacterium]|nr:hypothetical protein [Pseudomonadota bacterium]
MALSIARNIKLEIEYEEWVRAEDERQLADPQYLNIHKLLVAQRRTGPHRAKARKDLDQAEALIRVLAEHHPFDLLDAYEAARAKGPAWDNAIGRSLKQRPEIGGMIDAIGA